MAPPLLPFPLTICGIDELPQHQDSGVSHVLTILDPGWPDPEHFAAFAPHKRTRWDFHDIVTAQPGQRHPVETDVAAILTYGDGLRAEPVGRLLVHCHKGLSRSTATALILMVQNNPGAEREAFEQLKQVRPYSWPNSSLLGMADRMLGLGGRLVAAMKDHHRAMAHLRPEVTAYLLTTDRAGEVPTDL